MSLPQQVKNDTNGHLRNKARIPALTLGLCILISLAHQHLYSQGPPVAQPVTPSEQALQINPEQDRFDLANRYYESGIAAKDQLSKERYFNSAIPAFERYLDSFPSGKNAAEGRYRLGMSYLLTRRLNDATRLFRSVLNRHKQGHTVGAAAYKLASVEYNDRDYTAAIPYFAQAAKEVSNPSIRHSALYFQARCLLSISSNRRAIKTLTTLIEDEYRPNAYIEKSAQLVGHIHLKNKDYENALAAFEKLLGPSVERLFRGDALLNASLSAMQLDQFEKAELYLNTLLSDPKLKKWHPEAQLALMTRSYEQGNYEDVLKSFNTSDAKPRDPKLKCQRLMLAGQASSKLDKHNQAISYFSQAERAYPQTKLAFEASYYRLLSFYNTEGINIPDQVDAFIEIYGDKNPSSKYLQTALLMKAETLFSQKEYEKANRVYSKIRLRNVTKENRAGFLYQKGLCAAESGNQVSAIKTLTQFLNEFPDNNLAIQVRAKRGESYYNTGDHINALVDFKSIIASAPKSTMSALALQRCGEIKRKEKDFDSTIKYYQQLLNDFPSLENETKAHSTFWIGWAYFKKNEFNEAAKHFTTARQLAPESLSRAAGMRLILSYYSTENLDQLLPITKEVLTKHPEEIVSNRILSWIGIKSYDRGDYKNASLFLTLCSTPEEPKQTLRAVWKFLGKARLKTGKYIEALTAIDNTITSEKNPIAIADAHLDKARALAQLGRLEEAKISVNNGLELQKQGRINAGLRLVDADIAYAQKRYGDAANNYVPVAELFLDDSDLKPEAIYKASVALKANNDPNAQIYENMLAKDYPSYTKPKNWPVPSQDITKKQGKPETPKKSKDSVSTAL